MNLSGTNKVLGQIAAERVRQETKFPDQRLPLGTGGSWAQAMYGHLLGVVRNINDRHNETGEATWESVLAEEVFEALVESDPAKVREEMVQVAAVAVRIVENIDAGVLL